MFKIRTIAIREYLSAVRTKAFLVTLLLMPIILAISIGVQVLFSRIESKKDKIYAVVDRTSLGLIGKTLEGTTSETRGAALDMIRKTFGKQTKFKLLTVSENTPDAIKNQRQEISKQIESGEYEALIEIGANVLQPLTEKELKEIKKLDDSHMIRYQANSAGANQLRLFLEPILNVIVTQYRLMGKGIDAQELEKIQQPVVFRTKSLTRRDPKTGEIGDAADETQIVNIILPGAMIALMFMIVMVGAAPAMHGVLEEKSQRIAEVLLGSVTPFQLMAGKLAGIAGVSLTLAAVYLAGGFFMANYFGIGDLFPMSILFYFVPMLLLALLIFGSLFIAVGAAANTIKDTQTLLMPVMMLACLPMFALGPIMQDPSGPIARVCSFFPFATPMLLVARQSVPPGVPLWEMLAGITLVLVTTAVCVWAAGRIFRVGILMQGKTPRFADLIRWAIKG